MMPNKLPQSRDDRLQSTMDIAFNGACPRMNRAERRTAKGKLLVVRGQLAALEAKIKFLEEEKLETQNG